MEPTIISQREFARRLDPPVSEATVRKAIANSWIVKGSITRPSGTKAISYEIALEEWNASPAGLQAAAKNTGKPGSSYVPKKEQSAPSQKPVNTVDTKAALFDPGLAADKKQIIEDKKIGQRISLQRQALALQKEQGKLVDKDNADKQLFEFGKMLTDNILNVPARIIDLVRSDPSRNNALILMQNELKDALRSLTSPPDLSKY